MGRCAVSGDGQPVLIEIDGLTKRFGSFTAVDNVSFNVSRGEVLGFLGPNGAGKSTTMRMLAGFMIPTAGHRAHLRPRRADRRRGGAAGAGLPAGGRADLSRNDGHRLPDVLRQGARLSRARS